MHTTNKISVSALISGVLLLATTACTTGPVDPLQAYRVPQQTNYSAYQSESAVPGEYIIKRKGVAYLDTPETFAQKNGLMFIKALEPLGVELFQVQNPSALSQLQAQVEYAEPNYLRHLTLPQQSGVQQLSQYQMQSTASTAATTSGINSFIGVIDSGIDVTHPDLQGKLMPGYNAISGGEDISDQNGHGTFLAGLAVASNPAQQLQGVAPGSKILPVKALDGNGTGSDFGIADGIIWAVEYGAKSIVVSAVGSQQSRVLADAIAYANTRNVPVVVGAGGMSSASYPATDRGVIAVSSLDLNGQRPTTFSAQGQFISFSAVAQGVRSTLPLQASRVNQMGVSAGYGLLESPGVAAMQVASAIAILRSRQPNLTLPQIKQALNQASDDLGTRGVDAQYGAGRLNISRLAQGGNVAAQNYSSNQQRYNTYNQPRYPQPVVYRR